MRKMMLPETVVNVDGTTESVMVWALVNKLESAISASAEVRWPMAWMAEPADYKAKEHELRKRQGRSKGMQTRWRKDARIMLERMTSVCRFLETLPGSAVPTL